MLKKLAQKFISFKKKDENSALISVGLFIIVMAVIVIKVCNYGLPEEWKSSVEIWGTVSDWFMVVATLVTAVFLYKTLRSQMEVQKDQTRLFKIEELKYLREIKPNVTLNIFKLNKFDNDNHLTHLELSINLTTEKAKNVYYKIHTPHPHPQIIEYPGDIKNKKIHLPNVSLKESLPKFPNLFIEMTYKDCDGNMYLLKKEIIHFIDMNNNTFSYSISEYEELVKPVY